MESFIKRIYLYSFINAFILIAAIFALYFSDHGLTVSQISILIAIWSLTVLVLEIPGGIIGDKFSRRNVLILATILRGLGFLSWLLFPTFFGFAIGFLLWGIRNVLSSGTFEAFVYDELKANGKEQTYEKVLGKINGFTYLGLTTSTILGGFIAQQNFIMVLILSIITSFLTAITLFSIKSVSPIKDIDEIRSLAVLKNAFNEVTSNKRLLLIISFICLVFGSYVATDDFWPLIFDSFGFNISQVGILIAVVYAVASLAGYTIHKLDFLDKNNVGVVLSLSGGVLYIAFGVLKLPFLIPLLFLGVYLLKMADIKFEAQLQHATSSEQRATVFSIKSLMVEIVYMALILIFGFGGSRFGLPSVLVVSGGIIAIMCLIYWKSASLLGENKI